MLSPGPRLESNRLKIFLGFEIHISIECSLHYAGDWPIIIDILFIDKTLLICPDLSGDCGPGPAQVVQHESVVLGVGLWYDSSKRSYNSSVQYFL